MALVQEPTQQKISTRGLNVDYDGATDVLYVTRDGRPTIARHAHEELWLLRDVETGEVRGFFIEDFETVFLKRHPELAAAWREYRYPWRRLSRTVREGFMQILLGWLRRENRDAGLALSGA